MSGYCIERVDLIKKWFEIGLQLTIGDVHDAGSEDVIAEEH